MKTCDVCGKELEYVRFGGRTNSNIAISIVNVVKNDMVSGVVEVDEVDFMKKQLGEYVLGKTYNICWECWLKSLGIKP